MLRCVAHPLPCDCISPTRGIGDAHQDGHRRPKCRTLCVVVKRLLLPEIQFPRWRPGSEARPNPPSMMDKIAGEVRPEVAPIAQRNSPNRTRLALRSCRFARDGALCSAARATPGSRLRRRGPARSEHPCPSRGTQVANPLRVAAGSGRRPAAPAIADLRAQCRGSASRHGAYPAGGTLPPLPRVLPQHQRHLCSVCRPKRWTRRRPRRSRRCSRAGRPQWSLPRPRLAQPAQLRIVILGWRVGHPFAQVINPRRRLGVPFSTRLSIFGIMHRV